MLVCLCVVVVIVVVVAAAAAAAVTAAAVCFALFGIVLVCFNHFFVDFVDCTKASMPEMPAVFCPPQSTLNPTKLIHASFLFVVFSYFHLGFKNKQTFGCLLQTQDSWVLFHHACL